jgi:hypothetical protein
MLGRSRRAGRLLLLLAVTAMLLEGWAPAALGATPSPGVALALSSNGALGASLEAVETNGSALRYAMDGYFGPLVATLPGSNASKAALLADINATESDPLFAGLFGDHDGRVDATVDVPRFESLVVSEAKLIPISSITGVLNLTMDGNVPVSEALTAVSFSNAPGPDNSSAPIGVTATIDVGFLWSGTGHAHTFQVAWNLPSLLGNLSVSVSAVNLSFSTPRALTITSVTGLNRTQVANDPWGWGSASASGQFVPLPGHDVVIQFGPSFPTGDALIIGAIVVAAGALVGVLYWRRRGRRQGAVSPPDPSSSSESGVGPSSGSG